MASRGSAAVSHAAKLRVKPRWTRQRENTTPESPLMSMKMLLLGTRSAVLEKLRVVLKLKRRVDDKHLDLCLKDTKLKGDVS